MKLGEWGGGGSAFLKTQVVLLKTLPLPTVQRSLLQIEFCSAADKQTLGAYQGQRMKDYSAQCPLSATECHFRETGRWGTKAQGGEMTHLRSRDEPAAILSTPGLWSTLFPPPHAYQESEKASVIRFRVLNFEIETSISLFFTCIVPGERAGGQ